MAYKTDKKFRVPKGITVTSTHPQYRSRVQGATRVVKDVTVVPGTVYVLSYCYKDAVEGWTENLRTFLREHSEESKALFHRVAILGGFDITDDGRKEIATYLRSLIPSGLIVEQVEANVFEGAANSKFYWRYEEDQIRWPGTGGYWHMATLREVEEVKE